LVTMTWLAQSSDLAGRVVQGGEQHVVVP